MVHMHSAVGGEGGVDSLYPALLHLPALMENTYDRFSHHIDSYFIFGRIFSVDLLCRRIIRREEASRCKHLDVLYVERKRVG